MLEERMPVTPSVIRWAREESGCTLKEAKKPFRKIEEWESGKELPTYRQLIEMAGKFSCSVAVFFLPEPPQIEPIKNSFRTLPDTEKELIPAKIVKLLKRAKFFQYSIQELMTLANKQHEYSLVNIELTHLNIKSTVKKLRKILDAPIQEQISWHSHKDALAFWREKIEACGVFVFKHSFKDNNYSGFCLYDEKYPIIYINSRYNESRQIFTLFHEVAHLLLKTGGIDKPIQDYIQNLGDEHTEVICNRFAVEFLIPEEDFREKYANHDINDETISEIADVYSVSRCVVLKKYLDYGKIIQQFYQDKIYEYNESFNNNHGYNRIRSLSYTKQVNYHSPSYLKLVFQSYYNNLIGENDLREYIPGVTDVDKFEYRYLQFTVA